MPQLSSSKVRRPMAEINVVPFIDVMLVLLVIFMITAPLLTQGVKVDLPKTQSQALANQQKEPIIVTVDVNGLLYLNIAEQPNLPLNEQALLHLVTTELSQPSSDAPTRPVLVRGDQSVNYGKVIAAMALLQEAGAKSVGLITDPKTTLAGIHS